MAGGLEGLGYTGRRVTVTGCASGMGEAVARILGDLGAEVHAIDIQEPSVPHESYLRTDIGDPASVAGTLSSLAEIGPIDFHFNCAGVGHTLGPMACMRINWIGLRQLTEGVIPLMVDGGGIASIASDAGMGFQGQLAKIAELLAITDPTEATAWCAENPDKILDAYGFSKECIIAWTLQRAMPLAETRRIRINCIGPGPTDTAFMGQALADLGREFFDRFPTPLLGRMAHAEEQAWPMVLLNSPLNAVVTGEVLYTDQGFAGGVLSGAVDLQAMWGDLEINATGD